MKTAADGGYVVRNLPAGSRSLSASSDVRGYDWKFAGSASDVDVKPGATVTRDVAAGNGKQDAGEPLLPHTTLAYQRYDHSGMYTESHFTSDARGRINVQAPSRGAWNSGVKPSPSVTGDSPGKIGIISA